MKPVINDILYHFDETSAEICEAVKNRIFIKVRCMSLSPESAEFAAENIFSRISKEFLAAQRSHKDIL